MIPSESKNVYPNSHHVAATRRPDKFFGASPPPCGVKDVADDDSSPDFVVSSTICGGCLRSRLAAYLVQTTETTYHLASPESTEKQYIVDVLTCSAFIRDENCKYSCPSTGRELRQQPVLRLYQTNVPLNDDQQPLGLHNPHPLQESKILQIDRELFRPIENLALYLVLILQLSCGSISHIVLYVEEQCSYIVKVFHNTMFTISGLT
uniref:Uncharacterized protein n=1 Tax=Glossina pallidipes TaxID=7398 RepID=A0A1A9ZDG2_GLOPL